MISNDSGSGASAATKQWRRLIEALTVIPPIGLVVCYFTLRSALAAVATLTTVALRRIRFNSIVRVMPRGFALCAGIAALKAECGVASSPSIWLSILYGMVFLLSLGIVSLAAMTMARSPLTLLDLTEEVRRTFPQRHIARWLRRPEDAYFIRIIINNSIIIVPAWGAIVLLANSPVQIVLSVTHFGLAQLLVSLSQEALDHTNIHNRLFDPRPGVGSVRTFILRSIDFYTGYILNPMALRIPHYYYVQHVYIHHVENNGIDDTQTTLRYDRLSFIDFCRASLRTSLTGIIPIDVIDYLVRHKRKRQLTYLLRGYIAWLCGLAILISINGIGAGIYLFFLLMRGPFATVFYFSWHAFADPQDPSNVFTNSVNVTTRSQFGAFLGNHHIEHHLQPAMHWSKTHELAKANERRHSMNLSIELWRNGARDQALLRALWLRDFGYLKTHMLRVGSYELSDDEKTALLVSRLAPAEIYSRSSTLSRLDQVLGRWVAATFLTGEGRVLTEAGRQEKNGVVQERLSLTDAADLARARPLESDPYPAALK